MTWLTQRGLQIAAISDSTAARSRRVSPGQGGLQLDEFPAGFGQGLVEPARLRGVQGR